MFKKKKVKKENDAKLNTTSTLTILCSAQRQKPITHESECEGVKDGVSRNNVFSFGRCKSRRMSFTKQ